MSILARVNDSKDGQIQSKLERSVWMGFWLWGLRVRIGTDVTCSSDTLRPSVKPAGRRKKLGMSSGSQKWYIHPPSPPKPI